MDFVLFKPEQDFQWKVFFHEIELEFSAYGLRLEVKDRSKASEIVKKAFLKESSFGQVLKFIYERSRFDIQVVNIKLEVDTNSPAGSRFETKIVTFPEPFAIVTQDLSSLFAGKMHALLCREYVKGRDWFDFIWYIAKKASINGALLKNALMQQGPWREESFSLNEEWLKKNLKIKIDEINWDVAKNDLQPFLRKDQQRTLALWNKEYFKGLADLLIIT